MNDSSTIISQVVSEIRHDGRKKIITDEVLHVVVGKLLARAGIIKPASRRIRFLLRELHELKAERWTIAWEHPAGCPDIDGSVKALDRVDAKIENNLDEIRSHIAAIQEAAASVPDLARVATEVAAELNGQKGETKVYN